MLTKLLYFYYIGTWPSCFRDVLPSQSLGVGVSPKLVANTAILHIRWRTYWISEKSIFVFWNLNGPIIVWSPVLRSSWQSCSANVRNCISSLQATKAKLSIFVARALQFTRPVLFMTNGPLSKHLASYFFISVFLITLFFLLPYAADYAGYSSAFGRT